MSKNILSAGENRLGTLDDGDPDTPEQRAVLELHDGEPVASVSWDRTDPVARWFAGTTMQWGDDPGRDRYKYGVPGMLSFHDQRGRVVLVRCRAGASTTELVSGLGQGRIHPTYSVFERTRSQSTYERPSGVRTSISGLRDWVGVQSVHKGRPTTTDGRYSAVTYTLASPPDVDVPGVDGLRLVPGWGVVPEPPDVTRLEERLYLESWFSDGQAWERHLHLHRGVRDLIAVSRWLPEQITNLFASATARPDSPTEGSWAFTVAPDVVHQRPALVSRSHLVEYEDVGVEGVVAWLRLRDEFARAIDPLVSVLYTDTNIESDVSQAGIGLEALGYLLSVRDHGKTLRQAKDLNYVDRFNLVGTQVAGVLPFSVADWARDFADSYNAVKHVNRSLPDPLGLANVCRQAILVFRCWVAVELGVDVSLLKDRVETDPLAHPLRLA